MPDRPANPVVQFCPYCGGPVQPSYKFCAYCGVSLDSVQQSDTRSDRIVGATPIADDAASPRFGSTKRALFDPVIASTRKATSNISELLDRTSNWPPDFVPPRILTSERRATILSREVSFNIAFALEVLIVTAITMLAAWLRIDGLADASPGINIDESTYAAEIHRIMGGEWIGKFSGASLGVPTLQFYLTAPLFSYFESELFAMRIVSAVAGTLTIPVAHLFMRRFFPFTVAVSDGH